MSGSGKKREKRPRGGSKKGTGRTVYALALAALVVLVFGSSRLFWSDDSSSGEVATEGELTHSVAAAGISDSESVEEPLFQGTPSEALTFAGYNRSIRLTQEQLAVYRKALSSLPAPCCSNYPAVTCCCECNLVRTIWGLSKFLITERGYEAPQVKRAVEEWIAAINPNGFAGNACFVGGCDRPLERDGCGGMSEERFIF